MCYKYQGQSRIMLIVHCFVMVPQKSPLEGIFGALLQNNGLKKAGSSLVEVKREHKYLLGIFTYSHNNL